MPTDPNGAVDLIGPVQPEEPIPQEVLDNAVPLWEYFQTFVAAQNIALPLKYFHREIADTLMDAFLGLLPPEIQFIIINMPPRVGKTKILEAFASWGWAYFPDAQWIFTGYSGSLVEQSVGYIGNVIQSAWYMDAYGDLLHARRANLLATTSGGNLHGEGTGGSLTGKGAGLKRPYGGAICCDDLAKPDAALSLVEAESLKRWLYTTLLSRRNSTRWCPIIICGQRLAIDDVPGYVMTTFPGQYLLLKFPALDANDESVIPETIDTQTLRNYRNTRYGRFLLASQYQQEPIALGGNLIQTDNFVRYDVATARTTDWEMLLITIDTAMKIKEHNDFSCAELWGLKDRRIYLIDMIHGKWESPQLLANVIIFRQKVAKDFPECPLRCQIELKAAGIGLLQQLQLAGVPAEGIERDIDKVRRVQGILPYQESHLVYIPQENSVPWVGPFVSECAQFKPDGTHPHDDMVDPMVDAINELLGKALSILDVLGGLR